MRCGRYANASALNLVARKMAPAAVGQAAAGGHGHRARDVRTGPAAPLKWGL